EEGPHVHPLEAGGRQVVPHLGERVLARVEVEDELLLAVGGDMSQEGAAIAGVVDGAEAGRRRDGSRRNEVVQVARLDLDLRASSRAAPGSLDHRAGEVDADVAEAARKEWPREARVAAGEVEDHV